MGIDRLSRLPQPACFIAFDRYILQSLEEQAMSQDISIGEAARISGVKVPTIRYYEQIGLLAAPPRTEGNRRTYDAGDLRRLALSATPVNWASKSWRSEPC